LLNYEVFKMNRPQRKKKHIAEFTVYGCQIDGELKIGTDHDQLLDSLTDFLEESSMVCGGGVNHYEFSFFVECGQITYALERYQLLKRFLKEIDSVNHLYMGALVDANTLEPITTRKHGLLKNKGEVIFSDDFAMSEEEFLGGKP